MRSRWPTSATTSFARRPTPSRSRPRPRPTKPRKSRKKRPPGMRWTRRPRESVQIPCGGEGTRQGLAVRSYRRASGRRRTPPPTPPHRRRPRSFPLGSTLVVPVEPERKRISLGWHEHRENRSDCAPGRHGASGVLLLVLHRRPSGCTLLVLLLTREGEAEVCGARGATGAHEGEVQQTCGLSCVQAARPRRACVPAQGRRRPSAAAVDMARCVHREHQDGVVPHVCLPPTPRSCTGFSSRNHRVSVCAAGGGGTPCEAPQPRSKPDLGSSGSVEQPVPLSAGRPRLLCPRGQHMGKRHRRRASSRPAQAWARQCPRCSDFGCGIRARRGTAAGIIQRVRLASGWTPASGSACVRYGASNNIHPYFFLGIVSGVPQVRFHAGFVTPPGRRPSFQFICAAQGHSIPVIIEERLSAPRPDADTLKYHRCPLACHIQGLHPKYP